VWPFLCSYLTGLELPAFMESEGLVVLRNPLGPVLSYFNLFLVLTTYFAKISFINLIFMRMCNRSLYKVLTAATILFCVACMYHAS
jgi:hypothetical protein